MLGPLSARLMISLSPPPRSYRLLHLPPHHTQPPLGPALPSPNISMAPPSPLLHPWVVPLAGALAVRRERSVGAPRDSFRDRRHFQLIHGVAWRGPRLAGRCHNRGLSGLSAAAASAVGHCGGAAAESFLPAKLRGAGGSRGGRDATERGVVSRPRERLRYYVRSNLGGHG